MCKIVTKTYSQQVVEYIKDMLINGELAPGDKITELAIARVLSISQPPVREAMQILASEGIVEIKGKRGKYITKLSPKKVRDSYLSGGILESNVVVRSLDNFTSDHMERLEAIVTSMKESSDNAGSLEDFAKLDMNFHELLFEVADNTVARDLWFRSCQAVGKYFFFKGWCEMHTLQQKYERHLEILNVLKSGDKAQIEDIILEHYTSAGVLISSYAEKSYADKG